MASQHNDLSDEPHQLEEGSFHSLNSTDEECGMDECATSYQKGENPDSKAVTVVISNPPVIVEALDEESRESECVQTQIRIEDLQDDASTVMAIYKVRMPSKE